MSKVRNTRGITALVAVLVLVAALPLPVGAAPVFTDVREGDWFEPYVLKAYQAGLISGYEDATFKPNESIDKIATLVTLAKLAGMKINDPNVAAYKTKYNAVMDSNRIPVWAKDYIAYALEKGIVTQEELATFVKSDGSANYAKRYEVAIYFARALGLEQEAKSLSNVILGFKDNELISQFARGYIKVLSDRNVMRGDPEGKFNPNNEITRAEIATMLSTSLDIVGTGTGSGPVVAGTTNLEGTIDEVMRSNGKTVVKIDLGDGDVDIYEVAAGATVRVDGALASVSNLAVGQQGTFDIKDDKVVSIDVYSSQEAVSGVVKSIYTGTQYSMITIEKADGKSVSYMVTSEAVIKLDGSTVALEQIKSGDRVEVTVSNNYASRIEAETKTRTVMGIFDGFKTGTKLVMLLRKGTQQLEYEVDDDAEVKRDGRKRGLEDLRKGDEVELTTEYGIVTKIEAESVDRDVEGIIYSLLIARPHQLTIINEDGEQETFIVPVDVDIEIDGKAASIYDLRLDYSIEARVESDEVVSIEAESVVSQNEVVGTVEYVNTSVNVLTLKTSDMSTSGYVLKQINVNDKTRIMDRDGDRRYIRHIEIGDRLVVVGHSELGVFIADTIVITNR